MDNSVNEGIDISAALIAFAIMLTLMLGALAVGKEIIPLAQQKEENNEITNVSNYVSSYEETYSSAAVFQSILENNNNVPIILNGENLMKKKYNDSWSYLNYVRIIDNSILWKDVNRHTTYNKITSMDKQGNVKKISFQPND